MRHGQHACSRLAKASSRDGRKGRSSPRSDIRRCAAIGSSASSTSSSYLAWRESKHARRWRDGEGKHNVSASASAPELAHDRRVVAVGVELLGRNEPHSATGGVLIGERDELALQRQGTDVPTCQAKGGLAGVRTCNAIVSTEVEETSGTSASTSNLARRIGMKNLHQQDYRQIRRTSFPKNKVMLTMIVSQS